MAVPHRPDVPFERTPISVTSLRILLRRGGALSLVIALFALLAACSTPAESSAAGEPSDDSAGGGTVAVTDGVVELTAADLTFDASVIEAPAGEAFTISFTNNDSAPHNLTVYAAEGGDRIGDEGATIGEGETTELVVAALEPGTYYFQCDIHPDMNGTIVVEG
jgi:plastocyanin